MKNVRMRCLLTAAAVMVACPRLAPAQVTPDSLHHRNKCRLAAQVITTGNPAPHSDWAWMYIDACTPTERVDAYLAGLQQARTSSDLRLIHRAVMPVVWFHDGRLFDAVMDLAADPGAAIPARVVAFVALTRVRRPQAAATYDRFIGGPEVNGVPVPRCSGSSGHAVGITHGSSPMPADYRERIAAMARRIASDQAQPRDVRGAASCTAV